MAEVQDNDSSSTTTSSSFDDDEEEDTDHEVEAFFQRAASQDNDRLFVKTMLQSLGFEKKYVEKGMRIYEKSYGTQSYNADDITQIILQLQEKEEIQKQKQQLMTMNLDPKLAAELFGDSRYRKQAKSASKIKSKTSGYHIGDIIMYRNKMKAQIMEKLDEYLLICWPDAKPLYQRAVLWINVKDIQRESKHHDKKDAKYTYKFEKIWSELIVDEFGRNEDKKRDTKCQMMMINNDGWKIKSTFMKQSDYKYCICGAYEIYNESVTRFYNQRKDLILRFSLDSDENKLNELKLWYPITRRHVFKIINDGFKRKYGTMHARGFGHIFDRNARDALTGCYYSNMSNDNYDIQYLLYRE